MGLSTMAGVLSTLGVLASILWTVQAILLYVHRARAVLLSDLPADEPEGGWPRLAVIFAGRNEEAEVEQATRSMLAQDYPALDVIAVDDRSTDATGAILDRLAVESPRLRVVHVRELPGGWLGKNHALQVASGSTDAPWLLFTDADVVFAPGALRRAVAEAVRAGSDHVTVVPEVPTEGLGERLFLSLFNLLFQIRSPLFRVDNPGHRASVGIGAFNLVRAEPFRAIGGFRRLALSVDDDMRLGQAMKWAGYRPRVLLGVGAVSVRWHVGFRRMIVGLEKNFFAGLDFRLSKVALALFVMSWVGASPHVGLFLGPWWARGVCALGIVSLGLILQAIGRSAHLRWYHAPLLPAGVAMLTVALLRSTWVTLRRGGVTWRDHHYPIAELRAHARGRDAWLRELWLSTR